MTVEAGAQFAVVQFVRAGSSHHDDVEAGERVLVLAECLAGKPLQTITRSRATRSFARNRKSEPADCQAVRASKQCEASIGAAFAALEYQCKMLLFRKPRLARHSSVPCYGQSFARPFARRAFKTLRPFFVAMRARNPWVRARRRLLGW